MTGTPAAYDEVVARLRAARPDCHILRPWLPGHGELAASPLPDSYWATCEALCRETSRALGGCASRVHLVGYSLGARVAAGMLRLRPTLWESALLIGLHPGLRQDDERTQRRAQDAVWCRLLEEEGLQTFCERWQRQPVLELSAEVPAAVAAAHAQSRLAHQARGLRWAFEQLGLGVMPAHWEALSALELPIQLMAGERDQRFVALARELLPTLRAGRLTLAPNAGHNLVLERPELVTTTLLQGIAP